MAMACLYISEREVAGMLGHNVSWLSANSEMLERQYGFPKIDVATGKRHKESIEEWARQRNMPNMESTLERLNRNNQENFDAL